MGTDGAVDPSRVEQFGGPFCVYFAQAENAFEPGQKLMESDVCADAASFLCLKGVKL